MIDQTYVTKLYSKLDEISPNNEFITTNNISNILTIESILVRIGCIVGGFQIYSNPSTIKNYKDLIVKGIMGQIDDIKSNLLLLIHYYEDTMYFTTHYSTESIQHTCDNDLLSIVEEVIDDLELCDEFKVDYDHNTPVIYNDSDECDREEHIEYLATVYCAIPNSTIILNNRILKDLKCKGMTHVNKN